MAIAIPILREVNFMLSIKFKEPIPGTMILLTDDKISRGLDKVDCIIEAPAGRSISVNGFPCAFEEGYYRVSLPLDKKKLSLTATDEVSGEMAESHVWRLYTPKKLFRISIDDGIWFLQDIAKNQDTYKSIFDNDYLALFKKLHDEYGAKFHFNIYYTCPERGGFSLPELSDKFKTEWQDVNDWMTLSFHAFANDPGRPYMNSNYEEIYNHCKAVMDEIERFAGYRGAVTTIHFAEAPDECINALYDLGLRAILGDYSRDKNGNMQICYHATPEQFDTVRKYSFWKNPETKMIMFPCDTVLNMYSMEKMLAEIDWFDSTYPDRSFMDLLIHEQYFYKDYSHHLPDYEQRLRAGIEWCFEHGYVPGLVKEIFDFNDPEIFEDIK